MCTRSLYKELMDLPGPAGSVILLQSLALNALFFVGVPLILALNCLVLRALGWRLVRPALQVCESKLPSESSHLVAASR
jgi:hypothetical protein